MKKYFWAQVNAYGMAHTRFFEVDAGESLDNVVSKHFDNYKIVDVEEVTKKYAEVAASKILK